MKAVQPHSAIDAIAIATITGYQRYLSPHKGFACAHRVLHGGLSCSEYAKKAIAQFGLFQAVSLSKQRFRACKQAKLTLNAQNPQSPPKPKKDQQQNCGDYCDGFSVCDVMECIPYANDSEGCIRLPELDGCAPECSGCDSGFDCMSIDCCSWG